MRETWQLQTTTDSKVEQNPIRIAQIWLDTTDNDSGDPDGGGSCSSGLPARPDTQPKLPPPPTTGSTAHQLESFTFGPQRSTFCRSIYLQLIPGRGWLFARTIRWGIFSRHAVPTRDGASTELLLDQLLTAVRSIQLFFLDDQHVGWLSRSRRRFQPLCKPPDEQDLATC